MTEGILTANPEQAALLLRVPLRPLLTLLMTSPHSAGEVAAALDITLSRAQYLIGRLERAGLARVVSLQPRAGRAMKRYSVPAPWFVPFDVSPAVTLGAFSEAQLLPRIQRLTHNAMTVFQEQTGRSSGFWVGVHDLSMGDEAGPAAQLFLGDEPFMLNIGKMHLSRERASAFKRRLLGLLREFESQESPAEAPYSVALMLVRGEVD